MADPAWQSLLRLPPRTEPQPADDAGEDHLFCRPGMSLNPKYRRSGIKQLAIPRPRESLDLQGLPSKGRGARGECWFMLHFTKSLTP